MDSTRVAKSFTSNTGEYDTSRRPYKILVADDSRVDRTLLERTLSQAHYSVLSAKSGREAMELFEEHQPPIVLTDWMMPDLTGIELCQRMREQFQESYTYIIIVTGMTERDKLVIGLESGADDYLTKPFHSSELLARVGVGRRVAELYRQIEAKNRLLEEFAMTDSLTGLPNRRAVEVWVARELKAAARHDFPLWVAMADLDNFKSVNDTFGHEAGDTVVKGFAKILSASTRSAEICARIGGDEFLVVLTHTDRKGIHLAIDRIREKLAAQRFRFRTHDLNVTASFGIASQTRFHSRNLNQLMADADAALYAAKRMGGNRIEIASIELNAVAGNRVQSR